MYQYEISTLCPFLLLLMFQHTFVVTVALLIQKKLLIRTSTHAFIMWTDYSIKPTG